MREMKMLSWCDMCWHEGELQQPAEHTYTVGIVVGESRPALKLLELCELHNKIAVDMMNLLSSIGQLPDVTKLKPVTAVGKIGRPLGTKIERVNCPVCQLDIAKSSLITHVWAAHRPDPRPDEPTMCPTCRKRFDTGQGMSAHRRTSHQYDALADALAGVPGYKP